MAAVIQEKVGENIFVRMHPIHRILACLVISLITWLLIRKSLHNTLLMLMALWDLFALALLIMGWIVFLTRSTPRIRELARREDGSLAYVFTLIIVSAIASMFTVLLLIISKDASRASEILYLVVSVSGMLLSWILVHTTFGFHYAHIYYDDDDNDPEKQAEGLDFPGGEKMPDYLDFAYFAFVIGMTFQVSDVEITSRKLRRLALVHGLISFGLNTFVVALTINIIAGLKS
jgi:uncharacterized membrane protein